MFSIVTSVLIGGCTSSDRRINAPSQAIPSEPRTILAIVDDQPIHTQDLLPMLSEASGSQILDEYILSRELDKIAQSRGWDISDAMIQSELNALVSTIEQSTDPQSSARLVESIRARRGLGPVRFQALLRRNSILRKIVLANPKYQSEIDSNVHTFLNQIIPPPSADQLAGITNRALLVAQQQVMERAARLIVDQHQVIIMDRSLQWSRSAEN
ncbi:MAG: hypothetical protein AB8C13_06730 [Phycisphaerales bacterium]